MHEKGISVHIPSGYGIQLYSLFIYRYRSSRHRRHFLMSNQELESLGNIFGPHTRRNFLKRAGALGLSGAALTAFLEACGSTTTTSTTPASIPVGPVPMQTLIDNAKKEGNLQAIAIPPEWADYKEILAGYSSHYGIPVQYQAEAEYSSAQELEVF